MDAILLKDGVYVCVRDEKGRDKDELKKDPSLIIYYDSSRCTLYGGRVKLECHYNLRLSIDGINILKLSSDLSFNEDLGLETVTAYLNQIEQLGIDSFLKNYKDVINNLKSELLTNTEKLEQELAIKEDENKSKTISNYRSLLHHIMGILFVLMVNMNAGLDNHVYTEAYNSVINEFFK